MARKPDEITDPDELATYYLATAEFPSGFGTRYAPSTLVSDAPAQELASGFPVGRRFQSVEVVRVCDGNRVHLGHHARADGRWRLYAFADAHGAALREWADAARAIVERFTPTGADLDSVFDAKVVYPGRWEDVTDVPALFRPQSGPLGLTDLEKVFAAAPSAWTSGDIFAERGIGAAGAVVVVRPDQYVAHVLPLTAPEELERFLSGAMRSPATSAAGVAGLAAAASAGAASAVAASVGAATAGAGAGQA